MAARAAAPFRVRYPRGLPDSFPSTHLSGLKSGNSWAPLNLERSFSVDVAKWPPRSGAASITVFAEREALRSRCQRVSCSPSY